MSGDSNLGIGTREIYAKLRESIPFIEKDEYMKIHLDSAMKIVREWR